eukprot:comp15097_c0_seq1/m.11748 comp15097_c0_seq1/g.11748  ORF comp15097_c0_seq1/g.11748 comp15097_c0_seq1/m.11748 type:complete len:107 (-) comp15097_c0_seq1:468-788(-)
MSYSRTFENGMDKVFFITKKDQEKLQEASSTGLEGAILPSGEINWDCPCLQGMAHGICGPHFRKAFSCFANSTSEPRGQECVEVFIEFQQCMKAHPEHYGDKTGTE